MTQPITPMRNRVWWRTEEQKRADKWDWVIFVACAVGLATLPFWGV